MKKIMLIIGAIVVPLVLLGVVVTVAIVKATALDKESKAYVDEVTPKILADLRKDTLFVYACDELKTSAKPEELDKLFTWFTKLGQFKEYKGSTGEATVSITTAAGKVIIGN